MEAVQKGISLRSRRYRNRRLGEFLKELDLTEGRATGIPTIQDELQANGSPQATIETDEERTYFLIDIPCHPDFVKELFVQNKDVVKDVVKDIVKELSERQKIILDFISENPALTAKEMSERMSEKAGIVPRTIQRDLAELQTKGIITREGGRKEGKWVIINKE